MVGVLVASTEASGGFQSFLEFCVIGLTVGSLIALIALGYTMVYGILELINFAHGDVFMLGALLAVTLIKAMKLEEAGAVGITAGLSVVLVLVAIFCAAVNFSIDRLVYRPLRHAPKLAPLVSAIGVSF